MRYAVALAFLAGCCGAHRWSKADAALETTFAFATAVDGLESTEIVGRCIEANPVLGPCGNRVPLGVYIPLGMLVHAGVTWLIPHGAWRTAFLGLTAGAELDTIYANTFIIDRRP